MGKVLIHIAALSVALCAAAGFQSCNTAGCTELRSATPRADFYSTFTEKELTVDSLIITGIGARGDSALLVPGEKARTVYLPMRAGQNTVSWKIEYAWKAYAEEGIADTLTIDYDRIEWFAGEECGAMFKYHIRQIDFTRNLIDSIAIPDSMVINVDRPTYEIYFNIE